MRQKRKFLCVGTKKKQTKKGGKKRPPKICTFLPPHRFKKTNFTIIIILIPVYILKRSHTYIYRFSLLASRQGVVVVREAKKKRRFRRDSKIIKAWCGGEFFLSNYEL